jgi:hypothetical protein
MANPPRARVLERVRTIQLKKGTKAKIFGDEGIV